MTERLRRGPGDLWACVIWHVVKCEIHRPDGNGEVAILSLELVGEASQVETGFHMTVLRQNSSFALQPFSVLDELSTLEGYSPFQTLSQQHLGQCLSE